MGIAHHTERRSSPLAGNAHPTNYKLNNGYSVNKPLVTAQLAAYTLLDIAHPAVIGAMDLALRLIVIQILAVLVADAHDLAVVLDGQHRRMRHVLTIFNMGSLQMTRASRATKPMAEPTTR